MGVKQIEKRVYQVAVVCTVISLGLIVLLVVLQISFRFVLNSPLPWPEELSRLIFIYLVFLGGAVVSRRNDHIGIDLLEHVLTEGRHKVVLRFFQQLATVAILLVAVVGCLQILPKIASMKLAATGISMSWMVVPVLVGSLLMAFFTLVNLCSGTSLKNQCGGFPDGKPKSGESR